MIELSIITIIVAILLFLLFWKVTKIIWKAILFAIIILTLLIGLTGYLVYHDVQKLIKEEKIVILTSNSEAITGTIIPQNISEAKYIDLLELTEINNHIKEKDYDNVLKDKYLLLIIETDVFNNNQTIIYEGDEYKASEAIDLLLTNTTEEFSKLKNELIVNRKLDTPLTENQMIKEKADIAGMMIQDTLKDKTAAKNLVKNISFYPNRITLVLLTKTPSLLNNFVSKF